MTDTPLVAALLEERRGYVARGAKDRVAQVDAALKAYGIEVDNAPVVEAAVAAEVETAVPAKPKRR